MDKIILKNIKAYGHTGCLEEEKINGQYFFVTIELSIEDIEGKRTDMLCDTIDYSKVALIAQRIVSEDKGNLIEHLAYEIGKASLEVSDSILSVIVTVSKPSAPVECEFETMEVRIELAR
ncbi:MAG: dihydroneopterin aldolase [Saccharofermentans sp.]|nr:dihydroneopterin aldolase [Saccharofermentans sp.]